MLATAWDQRAKAKNILASSINKNLRDRYFVDEVTDADIRQGFKAKTAAFEEVKVEVEQIVVQDQPNEHRYAKVAYGKEDILKKIIDEELPSGNFEEWREKFNDLTELVCKAEDRRKQLNENLSYIDKKITDIHHFIEFGRFNLYQAWLTFKALKEMLIARRKVKDELTELTAISDYRLTSSSMCELKNALNGMRDRIYAPRVLTELFK